MQYVIRCIWPINTCYRPDCVRTSRGDETIYGPYAKPTIFSDLNDAYAEINIHYGATCLYLVEEHTP